MSSISYPFSPPPPPPPPLTPVPPPSQTNRPPLIKSNTYDGDTPSSPLTSSTLIRAHLPEGQRTTVIKYYTHSHFIVVCC